VVDNKLYTLGQMEDLIQFVLHSGIDGSLIDNY
jgi:hypothetical protein